MSMVYRKRLTTLEAHGSMGLDELAGHVWGVPGDEGRFPMQDGQGRGMMGLGGYQGTGGDGGDRLVNADAAARILGLKVATIRKLTHTKEIPCVRPTGRRCVRYRLSDLLALIRRRTQPERLGARRHEPRGILEIA